MCLALVKLPEAVLPIENIKAGWISNPDGGGFAYNKKGKIQVVKGLMTLKEFGIAYDKAAKANPAATFLVHFRIRTQGDRNEANTHPFEYNNMAMIHNGTIDGTGAKYGEGMSDTALFVAKFKDDLTLENLSKYKDELEQALSYNKLGFLHGDGKHFILNETVGTWDKGVWYSNSTYKPRSYYSPTADMLEDDDSDSLEAYYRGMEQ